MAEKRQTCRLRFCALRQIFFITARDCGKGEVNVLLRFCALRRIFFYHCTRLRQKRQTYRLRFCTLRGMLLLRAVAAKGANVPFAVLHFTANAFVTARLRQRRGKRAVCGFALYGECFCYRAFAAKAAKVPLLALYSFIRLR